MKNLIPHKNISEIRESLFRSAFVKISHKINTKSTESQIVKINDKLYRVRELG